MAEPKTLQEIISEGLTQHDMEAINRRVDKALTKQGAKDVQYGGDHYKKMGVEPWDVCDTWPLEQRIGYYRGGVLKYIMRMGSKDNSLQEAKKALHYAQKLVEVLGENSSG